MLSEYHEILYADNIVHIVFIVVIEVFKNSQLDTSLILKFLFVTYDFNGNIFICLVVKTLNSLPKTTLAKEFQTFISVAQVVFENDLVITLVIIIAMVENVHLF